MLRLTAEPEARCLGAEEKLMRKIALATTQRTLDTPGGRGKQLPAGRHEVRSCDGTNSAVENLFGEEIVKRQ